MKHILKPSIAILLAFAVVFGNHFLLQNSFAAQEPAKSTQEASAAERMDEADILFGDLTGDGKVTAEDARLALRGAVGLENYVQGSSAFFAADVDKSGTLDAGDARLILRAAVGLELLPVVVDPYSGMTLTQRAQLKAALPVMDGSTSMIPLDAGIRAALYEISFDKAREQVKHNKTWRAYYNLLWGNIDLLLTTPLSASQREIAAEQKKELTEIPITKEGFVFVVNAKNPVDTLTQQQLKDIYAGKITNWKQVGGNDSEIVAYQRNQESGSQNFMIDFMGDTPLIDAPVSLRPGEMGYLMDAIAINDNAENAIGYSVYTYAADMYRDAENTKFIKVDGVAPSRASMASGQYPLTSHNYAVFRSNEPADAMVRRLVDYILSDEGQTAVADAGYVAVRDIDYDYVSLPGKRYTGIGSGGLAPETPDCLAYSLSYFNSYSIPLQGKMPDGGSCFEVTCIQNKALQKDVNAFLKEHYTAMRDETQILNDALLKEYNELKEKGEAVSDEAYSAQLNARLMIRNAYLTADMVISSIDGDGFHDYYDSKACVWDFRTGARVVPEDLFYDGIDINRTVTDYLRRIMNDKAYPEKNEPIVEFSGLPETGWTITAVGIYFPKNNPYFEEGACFSLDALPVGTLTCETLYDPNSQLIQSVCSALCQFALVDDRISYHIENDVAFAALDPSASPYASNINDTVRVYMQTYFSKEGFLKFSGEKEDYARARQKISATEIRGKYFVFETPDLLLRDENGDYRYYKYARTLIFDLTTGNQLHWTDLLRDGWESEIVPENDETLPPISQLKAMELLKFTPWDTAYFVLDSETGRETINFSLPIRAVRTESVQPEAPALTEVAA